MGELAGGQLALGQDAVALGQVAAQVAALAWTARPRIAGGLVAGVLVAAGGQLALGQDAVALGKVAAQVAALAGGLVAGVLVAGVLVLVGGHTQASQCEQEGRCGEEMAACGA